MSTLLEVRGLTAGYEGTAVVRNLDFDVAEGEVVALLGANGAGKTTTLLVVSGLLRPMSGEVSLLGRPLLGMGSDRIARSGLAHVPEDRSLFPGLTVREHLTLIKGRSSFTVERVFEYFPELRSIADRRAGLLSGGEQQMLAIGRALTTGPKLLMVDEMSLGLAPVIVERLLPVLRALATESGVGILLVEQHVELALEYADRGYVMSHGDMALTGRAQDLLARDDVVVASYLGDDVAVAS